MFPDNTSLPTFLPTHAPSARVCGSRIHREQAHEAWLLGASTMPDVILFIFFCPADSTLVLLLVHLSISVGSSVTYQESWLAFTVL